MKQKQISIILVLAIAVFGVFLYSKLFLPTSAQIAVPDPDKDPDVNIIRTNTNMRGSVPDISGDGDDITVYWQNPDIPDPDQPPIEIYGQRPFTVQLVPDDYAVSVVIDAYQLNTSGGFDFIREVDCFLESTLDPNDGHLWHDSDCDMLSLENGTVYFGVRAFDDQGQELTLVNDSIYIPGDSEGNPRFGPFNIANSFSMDIPGIFDGINYVVSGTGYWNAEISGAVESVYLSLEGETSGGNSNYTLHLEEDVEPTNVYSIWHRVWDSVAWENGEYDVSLNFDTLHDAIRENVLTQTIVIDNELDFDRSCIPNWECAESDWSIVCTEDADGNFTRICSNPFDTENCPRVSPPPYITELCDCTIWGCPDWPAECPAGEVLIRTCTNECNQTNIQEWVCDSSTVPPEEGSGEEQETASVLVTPVIQMNGTLDGLIVPGPVTLYADIIEGEVHTLDFLYDLFGGSTSANTGLFACTGNRLDTDPKTYQCTWDATDTENGLYTVYAKGFVANADGTVSEYVSSNSVQIEIDHGAPPQEDEAIQQTDDGFAPEETDTTAGEIIPDEEFKSLESEDDYLSEEERLEIDSQDISGGTVIEPTYLLVKKSDGKIVKIAFEEPLTKGIEVPSKLRVERVENFSPVIGKNQIVFRGRGPANTWVTLFIYSSPIVVKTKTDSNGNFVYTLDKNLFDGKHEVYVTVTDENGRIREKSTPLTFFIKRAQAVSEEEYLRGDVNVQDESAKVVSNYLFITIGIIVVVLVTLLVFYYFSRKKQSLA